MDAVRTLQRLSRDETAQGLTEYAVVISALAFGVALIMTAFWNKLGDVFSNVKTQLSQVPSS
jgi:Flp pilus assembly pilin Flp